MTKYSFLVIVFPFQLFLWMRPSLFVCIFAKECVKEMQGATAANPERKWLYKWSQCYYTRASCTRECDKEKERGAKAANPQKSKFSE
jgi:hypothetical protein